MNIATEHRGIKSFIAGLSLALATFSPSPASAQVGTWKAYMAYSEPQQIINVDNMLFVRASNSLYTYNLNDQSITTYDKVNGMSDTYISIMAWNPNVKKLIVVYDNANIDIMDKSGNVTNISSLYTKSMTSDKSVNSIYIHDNYAYLTTGFGIVKVNMLQAEVSESYILNYKVTAVGIANGIIYARTDNNGQIMCAQLTKNLIDPNNWSVTESYPDGLFNQDNNDWEKYIETVNSLKPGGPRYNTFGYVRYRNGRLYTCSEDVSSSIPAVVQIFDNNEWIIPTDNSEIQEKTGQTDMKITYSIDVNPKNPDNLFIGSRIGVVEYLNGELVNFYNQDNSPITSTLNKNKYNANTQRKYQMITGIQADNDNNIWVLNSQAPGYALLQMNLDTREWTAHEWPELMIFTDDGVENKSLPWMKKPMIDSRGYIWFVHSNWRYPSLHRFDLDSSNTLHTKSIFDFQNQHGKTISIGGGVRYVAEDRNRDIWVGTSQGPLLLTKEEMENDKPIFTQVTIPRNDGTNYADYLLDNTDITCIAIDQANRKWFGTSSNGVYVISADNMVQEHHFMKDNSPLLSNLIREIAFNDKTGEVFIGTESGLCSYMTDATETSETMTSDNVYAYPNPVEPGYTGSISIVGLAFDSDVKIISTNGKLIAQGRSKGGMFVWDGCDTKGQRVASGIYMVAAATSDGSEGTVCKIAVIK